MIAVDTNILVYAHRIEAPWHSPANACVKSLAEGRAPWVIPWPCMHEFISVTTNPRIYKVPTPLATALSQLEFWTDSPFCVPIGESQGHLALLASLAISARLQGPAIHDARIAAICLSHGVSEIWTADRDFQRFPDVKTRNPLVG